MDAAAGRGSGGRYEDWSSSVPGQVCGGQGMDARAAGGPEQWSARARGRRRNWHVGPICQWGGNERSSRGK